ncbi:MAG: AMP-binding enzyme, partial [Woeseiaceae bacterium]
DEIRGDEVFAFIINNKEVSARNIFDHCMAHLTYFKVPGYIALVAELPLTASQKVSRGNIKSMARETLEQEGCADLREFKKRTK